MTWKRNEKVTEKDSYFCRKIKSNWKRRKESKSPWKKERKRRWWKSKKRTCKIKQIQKEDKEEMSKKRWFWKIEKDVVLKFSEIHKRRVKNRNCTTKKRILKTLKIERWRVKWLLFILQFQSQLKFIKI